MKMSGWVIISFKFYVIVRLRNGFVIILIWKILKLSGWVKFFINYFENVRLRNNLVLNFCLKFFEFVALVKKFSSNILKMSGSGMGLFSNIVWKFLKLSGWVKIFIKHFENICWEMVLFSTLFENFWNYRTR